MAPAELTEPSATKEAGSNAARDGPEGAGEPERSGGAATASSTAAETSTAEPSAVQSSNAEETAHDQARALFREGNGLIEQGRYLEASAKFRAAYSKWNNPKIRLNLATTLRALGRLSEALEGYEAYLLEGEPSEERRQEVERICSELRQQLARVELDVGPRVRGLLLDATRLDPASVRPLFLDPGRHVLVVEGPTGQRAIQFRVTAGEQRRLDVRAGDSIAAQRPAAVVDTPAAEQEAPRRRALGILGRVDIDGSGRGAVGAVGLGYALLDHWEISAGGMKGGNAGAWGGTQVLLLEGVASPTLGLSVPVFFLDSPYVGASAEAGTRFRLGDTLSVSARIAFVYFPRVPPDYLSTILVGSVGMEAWL